MLPDPDQGLSPTDYGWCYKNNLLQPTWFDGPSVPNSLFSMKVHLSNGNGQNATTGNANDSDSDDTIVLGQSEENTMERDDFDEFDLSNLCDDEPWTEEDSDSDGEEM